MAYGKWTEMVRNEPQQLDERTFIYTIATKGVVRYTEGGDLTMDTIKAGHCLSPLTKQTPKEISDLMFEVASRKGKEPDPINLVEILKDSAAKKL
jgi:hypothetical protein